jgi:hypothetical protein
VDEYLNYAKTFQVQIDLLDREFLEGIVGRKDVSFESACVTYIRHNCTNYDKVIKLYRRSPKGCTFSAYAIIRARILAAIAKHYPWLEAECGRQKNHFNKDKKAS